MNTFAPKSRFALILVILIAPFAGVSAASLIDYGTSAAADAGVRAAVGGSASSSNVNVDASAQTNVDTHTDASTNTNVVVTHDDAVASATDTRDMAASNVTTTADLKSYASTALRNDDNLSSIGFASDRVEVAYREPARFLGFIPTSVDVNVVAHNDGTVEVQYPWYSFLMLTGRSDLATALDGEVGASVNASSTWNASTEAALAAKIQSVLAAHLSGASTSTAE